MAVKLREVDELSQVILGEVLRDQETYSPSPSLCLFYYAFQAVSLNISFHPYLLR